MMKNLPRLKKLLLLMPLLLAASAFGQTPQPQGETGPGVPAFWVRPGFKVTLAAEDFGNARFMEKSPDGSILYVSQPTSNKIVTLQDKDGDGVYETKGTFIEGEEYNRVHGMFMCAEDGYFYFSTPSTIYRCKPTLKAQDVKTVAKFNIDGRPGGHWWRPIWVAGGYIYTGIGDPGNLTDVGNSEREKLWRIKTDGSDKTLWATGIRNTEKLQYRPGTTELYGCDHGSDNFGAQYGEGQKGGAVTDVNPPDEFNHYIQGFFYGHPWVTGLGLPRQEYSKKEDIVKLTDDNTPPAWCFGAHNAPCGWTFLSKTGLLGTSGDALVALHGSWNSTRKVGYAIQRICFDPATGKAYGSMPMVRTLNAAGTQPLARPVDVLELQDGSVLFSDDNGNKIFKLSKL